MLHHRDYSNSSKILYCLTKDHGLVHLIAKGAKNKKSPFFADGQPFRLLDIQFIKKSGLSILTSSQTVSLIQFSETSKQFSGFYINELLYRLIKTEQQDKALFMLYLSTMDKLLDEDDLELTLRKFEFKLLKLLGYQYLSTSNNAIKPNENYQLQLPDMTFSIINKGDNKLGNKQGVDIFKGEFIAQLSNISSNSIVQYKKPCKQYCRLIFNMLLDGKALKSRELFAQLKP